MLHLQRCRESSVVFGLVAVFGFDAGQEKSADLDNPVAPEQTHSLQFSNAPWEQVLDWLATVSRQAVVCNARPTGSFTILGQQKFTVAQIIDILNRSLAEQQLKIARRPARMGIYSVDARLLYTKPRPVLLEDLAGLEKREFVRVVYPLRGLPAQTAANHVKRMLGRFGQVIAEAEPERLILIDTVANLRVMVALLKLLEDPKTTQGVRSKTPVVAVRQPCGVELRSAS
jgi:hypothetical protein